METPLNRTPGATYRLQFNAGFTFKEAAALIEYLAELGISDFYASPLFAARPGSTHGYDVCSFERINPNLGSPEEFREFLGKVQEHRMGLLVDMVPNHMGAHVCNPWWHDVLEKGPASAFARYFDIDWNSSVPMLCGKVLLPVLGDHYGAVLERGELKIEHGEGKFQLRYFDHHFPLSPESLPIFESKQPNLDEINGTPGVPKSFNRLDEIIQRQHYRLAFWRVGPEELNYRRFFDITDLVSVRVEDPEVLEATHKLLFRLIEDGFVTGLRIDHPDGLRDPKGYFENLQKRFQSLPESNGKSIYVVAEKILSENEKLPGDWPVQGTTGYEYLVHLNGLFVARENETKFNTIYEKFTGDSHTYSSLVYHSKREILTQSLQAEVSALTDRLKEIAASTRHGQDLTRAALEEGIISLICGFPVYRTYVTAETSDLPGKEQKVIEIAVASAIQWTPQGETAIRFIAKILRLEPLPEQEREHKEKVREFVFKFQQLSGPAMAKGLEDTTFYRYFRLTSLNEVGGDPGKFGTTIEEFHSHNEHKAGEWPHNLNATETHDTKRGEDVRARLNVLSEIPEEWGNAVTRWSQQNSPNRKMLKAGQAPSPNDEYLLYQTLVGSWIPECGTPEGLRAYQDRIQAYMAKATKEAKVRTSWTDPNEDYESGMRDFVKQCFDSKGFIEDVQTFVGKTSLFGYLNSLVQVVLKITSPGIPDFYQGTELWDFSLVDPDNRRSIDFGLRKKHLEELREKLQGDSAKVALEELLTQPEDGRIKMAVTWLALQFRSQHRSLFDFGEYRRINAVGSASSHVISFARSFEGKQVIVVVPRLAWTLTQGGGRLPCGGGIWGDTRLPVKQGSGSWRNIFSKEVTTGQDDLALHEIFHSIPFAILEQI